MRIIQLLRKIRRENSLRRDFMFSLILAMIPAFLISLGIDYYFVHTKNINTLQSSWENKVGKAVHTLKKPLWHYDTEFLTTYAEILADDQSLSKITIVDDKDRVVTTVENKELREHITTVRWSLDKTIVHDGETIGKLSITYNNSEISKLTGQMIFSDLLVIIAILSSVLTVSWLLINRHILHPLRIMAERFHGIAQGDYSGRIISRETNELTAIIQEFNTMVDQLETRETALKESELKYRNLVESQSDIVFTANTKGELLFINGNHQKWTGTRPEEVLGRPFYNLFSDRDDSQLLAIPEEIEKRGQTLLEAHLPQKDGFIIPVELNFSVQYDRTGNNAGIIGIARNISNRRRAEEGLLKYEQMVASITDYMVLLDRDFKIQAINRAYLEDIAIERSKLIGSHILDLFEKQTFTEELLPFLEACLEGKPVKNELLLTAAGTTPRNLMITYYPIFEKDNSVSGVMLYQRDVTEQKTLEAKLLQSQRMEAIGTLAGGIAHDFNNIIGGIIGYAEMIEMFDSSPSSKLDDRIQHVLKGAYRARDLVDQILTFSRSSDSKKKTLKIGSLVRDIMQFLRALIPSTIEIIDKDLDSKAMVWADETSIHQILMNLCTNAAHAMKQEGGKLTVSLYHDSIDSETATRLNIVETGTYVVLTVNDTGIGIDPNVLPRIFDPFYTTKKTGEGTGMGLAVVHGIVRELQGAIEVESKPEQGTAFRIYLPIFDFNEQGKEECAEIQEGMDLGQGCILLVDDESELVDFSTEILTHIGYEVISTTSSVNARKEFIADPEKFDLVIADQTMPNITGLELARQFLAIRKDLPIILCTGFSRPTLQQEAKDLGIRRFVKKPYGTTQLIQMVRELIHPMQ